MREARSQECCRLHHYMQQAEPQRPRMFRTVIAVVALLLSLCLPSEMGSFVQLLSVRGQFFCFCDQILLHPRASVYFVCASYGGYRPLVSVSHAEALHSPSSACTPLLTAALLILRNSFSKGLLDTNKNKHFKVPVHSFHFRVITNSRYCLPKLEAQTCGSALDEWCRKPKIVPFTEEAVLSERSIVFHIPITIY